MSFLQSRAASAAFNPAVIESVLQTLSYIAMSRFALIYNALRVGPCNPPDVQRAITQALADISSDRKTQHHVVDETLWKVLHMSAKVAAQHDTAVQDRVDKTTAAVLSALYPHKPMMTREGRDSLLYRCVRETAHVFGPETLAVIASRYDQCFREKELLDTEAVALFEERYHHNVLDGYTARTCRPPPYSANV